MQNLTLSHLLFLFVSTISLIGAELAADTPKTPQGLGDTDWSGIVDAYEHQRHAIVTNPDGTHQARNPGQAWVTRFDGRAFTVSPDVGPGGLN